MTEHNNTDFATPEHTPQLVGCVPRTFKIPSLEQQKERWKVRDVAPLPAFQTPAF